MGFLRVLEILYTVLIVVSVYLVAVPKIEGLYIMVVGQFLAVPVFLSKKLYFAVGLMFILNALNIYGIINWGSKGVGI
jgi:hypothetical protein